VEIMETENRIVVERIVEKPLIVQFRKKKMVKTTECRKKGRRGSEINDETK